MEVGAGMSAGTSANTTAGTTTRGRAARPLDAGGAAGRTEHAGGSLSGPGRPEAPSRRPALDDRPLREQVRDVLRTRILTGHYPPGHRLVERDQAEELGVSRVPIREALRLLEGEGLFKLFGVGTLVVGFAFTLFEILVAFLQAYIFTILTGVYIQLALAEEH